MYRMYRGFVWVAIFGSTLVLTALPARGQVITATIHGTVFDPTGAAIPDATLTATNDLTGASSSANSGISGEVTLAFLPTGVYTVTVETTGFKTEVQSGLELTAGQRVRLRFSMEIGAMTESVTVTGETPLISTVSAEQRSVLNTTEVKELPLARRDWTNLLALGTGISVGGANGVTLNGLPPMGFRLTVDGADSEGDPELPSLSMYQNFNYIKSVSLEAIAEVNVAKGIASADIANTMSGNVNLITRSGTNDFHGSLFLNNQTENYAARNQFLSSKAPLVFNQFGGSIGGPILKNKLFFFGVYEGYREEAFRAINGNVPSAEFRAEAIAAVPEYVPYFDLWPLPNTPVNPGDITGFFQGAGSNSAQDNHVTVRADYHASDSNLFTFRYTRGRPFRNIPRVASLNNRTFNGLTEASTMSFFHTRASWSSETRVGYNLNDALRLDNIFALNIPGITCCLGFGTGGENLFKGGSSTTVEHNIALARGRHSLKFGGMTTQRVLRRDNVEMPEIRFADKEALLANRPFFAQVTWGVADWRIRTSQFGFYVHDDFKWARNFIVNMGLRYDYMAVPKERDGRLFNRSDFGFGPLRPPDSVYDADHRNFSPRLGFAWTLDEDAKTVVRGGAGVFQNPRPAFDTFAELVRNAADQPRRFRFGAGEIEQFNLQYPITNENTLPLVTGGFLPWAHETLDTFFPNPFSYQWHLSVQRQLTDALVLETGYVGTRGINLNLTRQPNQVDRQTGLRPPPPPTADPTVSSFGQWRYTDTSGASHYHSWQSSLRKRFSADFLFNMHYTWSSNTTFGPGDLRRAEQAQDFNDTRSEKGPPSYHVRHQFVSDFLYELPFAKFSGGSSRGKTLALGGWQFSGIFAANTGRPVLILQPSALAFSRPDAVGGKPTLDNFTDTLQYLNVAAFANVPIIAASGATARPGTLGRNAVRGPGAWNIDLALSKNLQFTEQWRLQIRADMFNAFNHTNLDNVQLRTTRSNFGRLTRANARVVQFNARLTF